MKLDLLVDEYRRWARRSIVSNTSLFTRQAVTDLINSWNDLGLWKEDFQSFDAEVGYANRFDLACIK